MGNVFFNLSRVIPYMGRMVIKRAWGLTFLVILNGFFLTDARSEPLLPLAQTDTGVVRAMIERLVPTKAAFFKLERLVTDERKDSFSIQSQGREILIKGTNGLSDELHQYLPFSGKP